MAAVTANGDATALDWLYRADLAVATGRMADGASALATVVRRWPDEARRLEWGRFIQQLTFRIKADDASRDAYLALVETMYQADFRLAFGLQPETFWRDLVLDALERGDIAKARAILPRIESPGVLLGMRVDRRFDALVALEPDRFDLQAAMRRASTDGEALVAEHPRQLGAFVHYAYALFDEGRHREVLAMCDEILAKVDAGSDSAPAFDDLADSLNWVYNHKAAALRALGRWDEALAVMETARSLSEANADNVSQTINLGAHYIDAGRFDKALEAVGALECSDAVSPYGCMQLHAVLYVAHLRLGQKQKAAEAFSYLSAHRLDAEDTWVDVTLESGDLDAAARRLIARLEDPDERTSALAGVQDYRLLPATPEMQRRRALQRQLIARADVSAAIDRVGRRGPVPTYLTPN